jgi:hypothetical protein
VNWWLMSVYVQVNCVCRSTVWNLCQCSVAERWLNNWCISKLCHFIQWYTDVYIQLKLLIMW